MAVRPHLVGTALPDAPIVTAAGTPTRLQEVLGGEPAVIYFLRAASCSVCLGHTHRILQLAADGALPGRCLVFVVPGDGSEAAAAARRIRSGAAATVVASGSAHAAIGLARTLRSSGSLPTHL